MFDTLIERLQYIMKNDVGVCTDENRLSQIAWLLFLAVFDANEQADEVLIPEYESIIPEGYRWRDWTQSKMTDDELLAFVNDKLFKTLAELPGTSSKVLLIREFTKDLKNFMKNGTLLRQLINEIDSINFTSSWERGNFNIIYEYLLGSLQKNNGASFTNRAITQLVVSKVKPKVGEAVADFACGTGGFLVDSLTYVKENNRKMTGKQFERFQNSLHGVEKDAMPYRLCVTNMLLHGIDTPNIIHGNSLETDVGNYTEDDKFDVIFINPPYGGSESEIIQKNFPAGLRNAETVNLFMIEAMYRLRKNGRCAVIVPNRFIFGTDSSKRAIKKKLIEEFNLHTVLRLPYSCFAPYTNIETSILFFDNTEEKTKDVWFYRVDLINGQKFSMTKNPITRDKFRDVDDWWDNRREIKDEQLNNWKSRKVSVEQIVNSDYSLDFCGYSIPRRQYSFQKL